VKRAYVVSKGAAADLREITRYTVAHWGAAQCRSYVAELERASEAVARGEGAFRDLSAVFPGLRVIVSGKHFISACHKQTRQRSSWPSCMSAWT
jgi:plasmid stabilization system protein ParE